MEVLKIKGGMPLKGHIKAAGAKNAMTKLLVASLLSDKPCRFYNVPDIGDVAVTFHYVKKLAAGAMGSRSGRHGSPHQRTENLLCSTTIFRCQSDSHFDDRSPLRRTEEDIIVPTVGGCNIGKRPIDFHISALQQLGAVIEYREMKNEGAYFAHAHDGLKGAIITFPIRPLELQKIRFSLESLPEGSQSLKTLPSSLKSSI